MVGFRLGAPPSTLCPLRCREESHAGYAFTAAVVSALCRETEIAAPAWVARIDSPEPFFAVPAEGVALRVLLMLELPPPFRVRAACSCPKTFLSRA